MGHQTFGSIDMLSEWRIPIISTLLQKNLLMLVRTENVVIVAQIQANPDVNSHIFVVWTVNSKKIIRSGIFAIYTD